MGTETLQAGFAERLPSLDDSPFPVLPYSGDGDDKAFHAAEIPTLWYRTESNYKRIHTRSDSYEFVDARKMAGVANEAARMARKIMRSLS